MSATSFLTQQLLAAIDQLEGQIMEGVEKNLVHKLSGWKGQMVSTSIIISGQ
jgi:hypothetical protein